METKEYTTTIEAMKALLEGKKITTYDLKHSEHKYIVLDDEGELRDINGNYCVLDGDCIYRDYISPLPDFAKKLLAIQYDDFNCAGVACNQCPCCKGDGTCAKQDWRKELNKLQNIITEWEA